MTYPPDPLPLGFDEGKGVNLNMKHKLVLIEWLDSKGITNQGEYLDEIEAMKPCKCLSVGFLIEETKEYKTIAQSINGTQGK